MTQKKAKLRAATVGGTADDTEAAFYDALRQGDIERLMACWADEDDIVCVHPGGPRLVGVREIRAAFEALFARGAVQVTVSAARKVDALASAVHNVLQAVQLLTPQGPREAYVIATNVYHKTAQGWRMVAHHTSPGSAEEGQPGGASAPVLH